MRLIVPFAAVCLAGCDDVLDHLIPPSDETIARECKAKIEDLQKAKREMRAAKPYSARDVGECTIMRKEGRDGLYIYRMTKDGIS